MTPLAVASATSLAHLMPRVGVIHTIIALVRSGRDMQFWQDSGVFEAGGHNGTPGAFLSPDRTQRVSSDFNTIETTYRRLQ
jgi:hypothetical protein